jgi:hypothetical protein
LHGYAEAIRTDWAEDVHIGVHPEFYLTMAGAGAGYRFRNANTRVSDDEIFIVERFLSGIEGSPL